MGEWQSRFGKQGQGADAELVLFDPPFAGTQVDAHASEGTVYALTFPFAASYLFERRRARSRRKLRGEARETCYEAGGTMRIRPRDWQMKTRNDALLSRPSCKSIVFVLCVVAAGTGCKQTQEADANVGKVRESSSPGGQAALPSTQKDSERVQRSQAQRKQREHATEPAKAEGGAASQSKASASVPDSNIERCIVRTPENPPEPAPAATHCPGAPRGFELDLPAGQVAFVDAPGTPLVDVELALTPKARARGLMYRTDLPEDAGMLFSWKDEHVRSFWMKNTCIPLDMLFIAADGVIVGILEQVPTLNQKPRSISCKAAHVLEVNAGYTRRHGIFPGQKVAIQK